MTAPSITSNNSPIQVGSPLIVGGTGFSEPLFNSGDYTSEETPYVITEYDWGTYAVNFSSGWCAWGNYIFSFSTGEDGLLYVYDLESRTLIDTIDPSVWFTYGSLFQVPTVNVDPITGKLCIKVLREVGVRIFVFTCITQDTDPEDLLADTSRWDRATLTSDSNADYNLSDGFVYNGKTYSLRTSLTLGELVIAQDEEDGTLWDTLETGDFIDMAGMFFQFRNALYFTFSKTGAPRKKLIKLIDEDNNEWEDVKEYTDSSTMNALFFHSDEYLYYAVRDGANVEYYRSSYGNTWDLLDTQEYNYNLVFGSPGDIIYESVVVDEINRVRAFHNSEWSFVDDGVDTLSDAKAYTPKAFNAAGATWLPVDSPYASFVALAPYGVWAIDDGFALPELMENGELSLDSPLLTLGYHTVTVTTSLGSDSITVLVTALTALSDYSSELLVSILEQYKNSPNIKGMVGISADQLQDLETAILELQLVFYLDAVEGVVLDVTGELLNEARNGREDDEYREALKGAWSKKISGTPEEIIAYIQREYGATVVEYIPQYPANYRLILSGETSRPPQKVINTISPAGVLGSLSQFLVRVSDGVPIVRVSDGENIVVNDSF